MKLISIILTCLFFFVGCSGMDNSKKAPPAPTYFQHTVKYSGETLAAISEWYTGQVSNWKLIANANPSLKPERIKIGNIINIPTNLVKKTKPFPKPTVKVKPKVEAQETQEAPAVNPTDQSDNNTADTEEASKSDETAQTDQPTETSPEASAPTSEVVTDSPAAATEQVNDEAEREKLREKTRLELLNDVLSSEQPEAPKAE